MLAGEPAHTAAACEAPVNVGFGCTVTNIEDEYSTKQAPF